MFNQFGVKVSNRVARGTFRLLSSINALACSETNIFAMTTRLAALVTPRLVVHVSAGESIRRSAIVIGHRTLVEVSHTSRAFDTTFHARRDSCLSSHAGFDPLKVSCYLRYTCSSLLVVEDLGILKRSIDHSFHNAEICRFILVSDTLQLSSVVNKSYQCFPPVRNPC